MTNTVPKSNTGTVWPYWGNISILVQYVKGVAVFLEGRLKDMLIVSGHDQDDKYREWSILEEIEKILGIWLLTIPGPLSQTRMI